MPAAGSSGSARKSAPSAGSRSGSVGRPKVQQNHPCSAPARCLTRPGKLVPDGVTGRRSLLLGQALQLRHHRVAVPVKANVQAVFLAAAERNALTHDPNLTAGTVNGTREWMRLIRQVVLAVRCRVLILALAGGPGRSGQR